MSTFIKISGGQSALLQANQVQAAANRQAALERMSREKAGQQGKRERDARRKQEGLDQDGRVIFGVQPRPQPTSAPGVFLVSDATPLVSGVGIKAMYSTELSNGNVDWSVKVSIGAFTGLDVYDFTYIYRINEWNTPVTSSGLPTTWAGLPLDVGRIDEYANYFADSSEAFDDNADHSGGTYTIARDITSGLDININNSRFIQLPDGLGGMYIVFILNRLHRKRVDRITKQATTVRSLVSYKRIGEPVDPVLYPGDYYVNWNTNPTCTAAYASNIMTPEDIDAANATYSHYWAGVNTVTSQRTTVKEIIFSDYSIHVYHATRQGSVQEIEVPTLLNTWLRALNPPLTLNSTQTITSTNSVNLTTNWATSGVYEKTNTWDGTHDGAYCAPNIQYQQSITQNTINPFTYPVFDQNLYGQAATVIDIASYTDSLLFVLGGKTAGGLSAAGPSFAFAYNKDIKGLTTAQLQSYEYMQAYFLGAKPSAYVSSCVLNGQCSNETWYDIGWASTRTQPPDIYSLSPIETYKAIKHTVIPEHLRSGYERYYVTNWGSPALCRRALSLLGL